MNAENGSAQLDVASPIGLGFSRSSPPSNKLKRLKWRSHSCEGV